MHSTDKYDSWKENILALLRYFIQRGTTLTC